MKPRPSPTRVRQKVLTWFSQNGRDLPWRRTNDPYLIAVSEVMLQQTQVDRVVPKFLAWQRAWSTTKSLARAPLNDVLRLWSGLGYNSRALRLRDAAKVVMEKFDGQWPKTVEELEALPGFGPYTSRAVASFAYNQNVTTIDTNIRRILTRVFFGNVIVPAKKIEKISDEIFPQNKSATWHAALMDFGSAVCVGRKPKCEICPLQNICRAYPAVLTLEKANSKNIVRFEQTDRFWRGELMRQFLKNPTMSLPQLLPHLKKVGDVDKPRIQRLLRALTKTGLLREDKGRFEISR